jgi:hypothetical protein
VEACGNGCWDLCGGYFGFCVWPGTDHGQTKRVATLKNTAFAVEAHTYLVKALPDS